VTNPGRPVIAIDGPAGSGKSTLARRLAETLDLPYINTGLMYRALTLRALTDGVDPSDGPNLAALARRMRFDLDPSLRPAELLVDGRPPAPEVTSTEVESTVSFVARHPEVREVLRAEQRRLAAGGGVVEGRDIGTIVAPTADVKLFLAADEGERIARRSTERRDRGGEIARALSARDALDAGTNPLEPAADAVAIDTTGMDADAVFERALSVIRSGRSDRGR
jgi:cytidylate kinase